MNKELYVTSTPHETKVGLVEDDQLAEVYFERENEYTLAGSIYKGRVTRVLPGMQSAFVDIGLERDAFLYVSDFLDLAVEEDDEDFGEVVVKPQFAEMKQQTAEAAPMEAEAELLEEEEEGGEEEPAEPGSEAREGDSAGTGEGARRWRGRRRRRGRRGGRERVLDGGTTAAPAGDVSPAEAEEEQPEPQGTEAYQPVRSSAEIVAPEEPRVIAPGSPTNSSSLGWEQEPSPAGSAAPSDYSRMVLPGESIARYNRTSDAEPREERPAESRPESFSHRRDRDDFRGRRGGRDRDRDRGDRDRGRDRERRDRVPEEREALPENYIPIVLPGESISKYRPKAGETPEARAAVTSVAPEAAAAEMEKLVPEPVVIEGPEAEEPSAVASAEVPAVAAVGEVAALPEPTAPAPPTESEPTAPSAEEPAREARLQAAPRVAHYRMEPAETSEEAEVPPPARVEAESLDAEPVAVPATAAPVPAVVHVGEDEPVAQPKVSLPEAAEPQAETPVAAQETAASPLPQVAEPERAAPPIEEEDPASAHRPGAYSPEGGTVVHEEIDEEEAEDITSYHEHFDTDKHVETEEAVYDRRSESAEGEIGQVLREDDEEEALRRSEYEFGDEFEESEMLAEAVEEDEEDEEAAEGEPARDVRVELRAPSSAALQQPERGYGERPGRDRRPQRRGGRPPMRTRRDSSRHVPLISDLLKEGQEILVQIAKEPIGKKGARITSHIALPGRFLVYMPTVNHIGVSRKISSDEERQRLKRIVASERENGHGGFIVRTAAAGIKEEDLRVDIRFLKHLWNEIRTRAENGRSPALIYHDLNLVERILRDQVTQEFSQIWVDVESEYERVVRFASRFQPNLVRRIKLYTKPTPLFEQFGLQEEINKSLKSKVWLKSGGYIVINQTEALVAIDINTGKYVGKTARLEDTIVKTNCDAIKEIVRQIRLRDLGGIIVIDFIDMDERKNRQKVMQTLEEALKADRAPSKVLQFNDFGLVAITRKRVKQSLERTLGSPCPYCSSTGFVKSVATVCNEIYVEMRKVRQHLHSADVTLRVNPEVAKELKSSNGKWLTELEELVGKPILVKSDALVHQEQFDIQF